MAAGVLFPALLPAQKPAAPISRNGGQLTYAAAENGDRIPDYSFCGYALSERDIPLVPNKIFVRHTAGDATALIQSAIDYVSGLKPGADGFRGAVLLDRGTFEVAGELFIRTSGVVLRGSGFGEGGTTLYATGNARETLVTVKGRHDLTPGDTVRITTAYVSLNAQSFEVSSTAGLKAGSRIRVRRIGSPEWIAQLGTGGERPGNLDLVFDRTVTGIRGNTISIDVPLTNAIAESDGGGTVIPYTWPGRIENIGVEFLNIVSRYDESNPKDEEHAWYGVNMQDVENAWVRQVTFKHLAGSAVVLQDRTSKITVRDCISLEPVSEIAGGRRYTFYTMGQQTLFQHCFSEYGYHDFIVGNTTPGPNAFVQCRAEEPHSFSGALGNWVTGLLLDDVYINGQMLGFQNRDGNGNRAGWTGANSLMWNCQASVILNYSPPTASNWAFGCWGQFPVMGLMYDENAHISPRSLFYTQLAERLGRSVSVQGRVMPMGGESSSSPSMEMAARLTQEALQPLQTLLDWIQQAEMPQTARIVAGVPDQSVLPKTKIAAELSRPFAVENGWLTWGGAVLTGRTQDVRWWNGSDKPVGVQQATNHITRYVPGRTGFGLTDDLDEMTDGMVAGNVSVTDFKYALWYDRRRDDHERFRRMDGEVWAPFYELPFARSGRGRAWDGLSRYDLTRYNNWYFKRLAEYTCLGGTKGLVLFNQHYQQHNILEAGAHYADFPWRPANNINGTPFVEPVNYAADKRIFYDQQFYDVSDPAYAALHKAYIRRQLDNFPEESGVVHATSAEYTGPFHFVKFWLETIGEWERETGKNALVALSATKDVQDQVLADASLAAVVDLIDIRYWSEGEEGFDAPPGGAHLAPRQHVRIKSGGKSGPITERSVYRAVRRYREANPGKAVAYNSTNYPQMAWAAFMAGGSMAGIPRVEADGFLQAAAGMTPTDASEGCFLLSGHNGSVVYPLADQTVSLLSTGGHQEVVRIDARSGKVLERSRVRISGGKLSLSVKRGEVVWVR